jgi:hypothetical protein
MGLLSLTLCGLLTHRFKQEWPTFITNELLQEEFFTKYRNETASMLTILSVFLIATFVFVLKLLKEILPDNLSGYRKVIINLFGIFIVSYNVRTCF